MKFTEGEFLHWSFGMRLIVRDVVLSVALRCPLQSNSQESLFKHAVCYSVSSICFLISKDFFTHIPPLMGVLVRGMTWYSLED